MSTNATPGHESSANDDSTELSDYERELALRCGTVAIDATGAAHRIRRHDGDVTMYVTRDGDVEHVERLNGRDPEEWISYVRFKRGIVDSWLDEDLGFLEGVERLRTAREQAGAL